MTTDRLFDIKSGTLVDIKSGALVKTPDGFGIATGVSGKSHIWVYSFHDNSPVLYARKEVRFATQKEKFVFVAGGGSLDNDILLGDMFLM